MFTDVGFHLKSGFKKLLCSPLLVFTLILVSQKYCVHQFFLYGSWNQIKVVGKSRKMAKKMKKKEKIKKYTKKMEPLGNYLTFRNRP